MSLFPFTVLVSADLSEGTKEALASHGATVVSKWNATVAIAVVPSSSASLEREVACYRKLRGHRIPIVTELWVKDSIAGGCEKPKKAPYTVFDPFFLSGLCFCSSELPRHVKKNIHLAVVFFGGSYDSRLTTRTDVLISGCVSKKTAIAVEKGIQCESVEWLENSIEAGKLLPFASPEASRFALELMDDVLMVGDSKLQPCVPPNEENETTAQIKEEPNNSGEALPQPSAAVHITTEEECEQQNEASQQEGVRHACDELLINQCSEQSICAARVDACDKHAVSFDCVERTELLVQDEQTLARKDDEKEEVNFTNLQTTVLHVDPHSVCAENISLTDQLEVTFAKEIDTVALQLDGQATIHLNGKDNSSVFANVDTTSVVLCGGEEEVTEPQAIAPEEARNHELTRGAFETKPRAKTTQQKCDQVLKFGPRCSRSQPIRKSPIRTRSVTRRSLAGTKRRRR